MKFRIVRHLPILKPVCNFLYIIISRRDIRLQTKDSRAQIPTRCNAKWPKDLLREFASGFYLKVSFLSGRLTRVPFTRLLSASLSNSVSQKETSETAVRMLVVLVACRSRPVVATHRVLYYLPTAYLLLDS